MRPVVPVLVVLAAVTTSGCGPLLRMMGDAAANAMTQKTADLRSVAARLSYTTNLFPRSFNLPETEALPDTWQEGQNGLSVVLLKRQGIGLFELDGGIGFHAGKGEPRVLPYMGKGSYWAMLPKNDLSPKTIILEAGGKSAKFQVAPAKPITIKSINGQAPNNATIDLGKDLVLELAHPPGAAGTPIKLSLIVTAVGQRALAEFGVFKSGTKMVIPKAAFRNLQIAASHEGAVNLERGANLLVVERFDHKMVPGGVVGAVELTGKALSWAPVNVTGDWRPQMAMTLAGELPAQASPVVYRLNKPNAFYGPPLQANKAIALGSLRARGTLFQSTTNTSTKESMSYKVTTTTTTTLAFPELPDGHWQSMLQALERGLATSLKRATGVTLLPVSRMASSPTYKALEEMSELTDSRHAIVKRTVYVEKPLKGSRMVFPESFGGMVSSVSSTFAADRPVSRMLSESKLEGVLTATLDVQIATQKGSDKLVLLPRLSYAIYGAPNGYSIGPTSYGDGVIEATDGVPFDEEALQANPEELERVVRLPDLLAAFEKNLRDLRVKEQAEGYDAIWRLK